MDIPAVHGEVTNTVPGEEIPEDRNNCPQESLTSVSAETDTGPIASIDSGVELPGNTPATIKPKPSTYYTVVNSTHDDIVFISKREILNKKWNVKLTNLSPKDIKLLQLSTNMKRPIKPVVTQDISLDDIDDMPAKPKRKPRPRLRPSSQRIAAQALVNLQRNGVHSKPSLKYTLPGMPIKNQQSSMDNKTENGDKIELPGEMPNIDNNQNTYSTNSVPLKTPSEKKWSDLDTDDANDNYDGDTEDYDVPAEDTENTAPVRKPRHKRKKQCSPQSRGNFSVQLHACTAPEKKYRKQKCTKCDFVARSIAELNSHYK